MGSARPGRPPGRHYRGGVLPLGRRRPSGHPTSRFPALRGAADRRRGRRPRPRPGLRRHYRCRQPRGLGSAVPDRSEPDRAARRGILGPVSHDTQGVHRAAGRAGAVAVALRPAHVDPVDRRRCRGSRHARRRLRSVAFGDARPGGRRHRRHAGARDGGRRVGRRDRLRRVLHLLQLLPGRLRPAAGEPVLPARRRAAVAGDRRPAGIRVPALSCSGPVLA